MGQDLVVSYADEAVTPQMAMSITAFSSALNAVSDAFAQLPIHVFKTRAGRRVRDENSPLQTMLRGVVNEDGLTAFDWMKGSIVSYYLWGRAASFIRRATNGEVLEIIPLNPTTLRKERFEGRWVYRYTIPSTTEVETYEVGEVLVLDALPDWSATDGCGASAVSLNVHTIGRAIAAEKYLSRTLSGGGIVPSQLVCSLPSATAKQIEEAYTQAIAALAKSAKDGGKFIGMPPGFELKPVGVNPSDLQLPELEAKIILDVARIFNLPPVFLQDLSTGTYANTEQQAAILIKHCLMPRIVQWTAQANAKLAGRGQDIEINVDGFLRGDYAVRMAGHATSIQHAIRTPDEVRALEGLEPVPGGDKLFIQGAMVPLEMAGQHLVQAQTPTEPKEPDEQDDQNI
ncbi:phage portal protein [Brevundimonas sp.]|uniref:phage portal protein n=1 Tax=Brevundimonas sp. TaxID=1871086 RepID=UPI0035B4ADDC